MTRTSHTSLIKRMAAGDRATLSLAYGTLNGPTADHAVRTLSAVPDVHAVVHATFVEVWWLSRFHTGTDIDVPAWIIGIAARRAAELHQALTSDGAAGQHDDRSQVALVELLGEAA